MFSEFLTILRFFAILGAENKKRGHKIFLDLKLHDIPNTVKKSMAVLSRLDVDMTNLHAAGTISMMEAAPTAASSKKEEKKPEPVTAEETPVKKAEAAKTLCDMQLVSWVLSQFSTINQVKDAIKNIDLVTLSSKIGAVHWRIFCAGQGSHKRRRG